MSDNHLRRLSSFAKWPIASDSGTIIRNFASKASAAFFERSEDCVDDEVVCKSCGVSYKNWKKESPFAVHRTISPKCIALNPSSAVVTTGYDHDGSKWEVLQQNPYNHYIPDSILRQVLQAELPFTQEDSFDDAFRVDNHEAATPEQEPLILRNTEAATRARRQLFTDATIQVPADANGNRGTESSPTSCSAPCISPCTPVSTISSPTTSLKVLDQPRIIHPFQPKYGGYNNLFASYRVQTFPGSATSVKSQSWAEEGFVFREQQQDVVCVFCGVSVVLNGHQPRVAHEKSSPSCPFVMGFDVGNIGQQAEKDILCKFYEQKAAEQNNCDLISKYPQYESEDGRLGTYQGWPKIFAKLFPAALMASAGFFYSGASDKVGCYCCGVELYDWDTDDDVWKTHAKVSPICLHVINHKGQEFIEQAANAEIGVTVMPYKCTGGVTSSGGIVGEEPGSPTMDMKAIKAAQARQYTWVQIQHAITKFFRQTSRFPNEAILLGTLKAADENHSTICKQQQQLHKVTQEKEEKDTVYQEIIQEKDTRLQEKDTRLQEKDTQLHQVIQEKDITVQTMEQQLTELRTMKDQQLAAKDHEHQTTVSQMDAVLQMQDQQIQSLMQQVQRLRADQQQIAAAARPQDAAELRAENEALRQSLACKICMADKPRMIFLPCGHLFCCAECTSRLPDKRCPVCRQDISEILPAFVA